MDFLFCRTLFRDNKVLWLPVWIFHGSVAMIVAGHVLGISSLRGQFTFIGFAPDVSISLSRVLGAIAGTLMTTSIVTLLVRRLASREIRKLSQPEDYFSLLLLLAISLTGMLMYIPQFHPHLVEIRSYFRSLFSLRPGGLPEGSAFRAHFLLANFLMLYFPFSRLLHSGAFFFNKFILMGRPPVYPTPGSTCGRPGVSDRSVFSPVPAGNAADREGASS
jgi:nitrate reductase gamma subunit